MNATPAVTAASLLRQLEPYGPVVEGESLIFTIDDPPDELFDRAVVLATGIRAILTGKRWYCNDKNGRGVGPLEFGALRTDEPIPTSVVRLIVEGDVKTWHRVHKHWKKQFPELFTTVDPEKKRRAA